jgi:ubiquinone/menaquinone biosynthesis C-methylase UbiE
MSYLKVLEKHWEAYAQTDPLWAICTDPDRKGRRWDPADIFASGEKEIAAVLQYLDSLGLILEKRGPALDFGCGVGRLTQAIASRFDSVLGVDISPTMIELARNYNRYARTTQYVCNRSEGLPFENETFTFIYSSVVLQHIAPVYIGRYLAEFFRVLKPNGVLVFQTLDRRKGEYIARLRERLRIRTRVRALLWAIGLLDGSQQLWMQTYGFKEAKVRRLMHGTGCRLIDVQLTNSNRPDFNGHLEYLASEPRRGLVSKQYCIVRDSTA